MTLRSWLIRPPVFAVVKLQALRYEFTRRFVHWTSSRICLLKVCCWKSWQRSRAALARSMTPPPTRIELVKELIHSHLQEPLTLSALAKHVGMHPVYLAQAFRKVCGCTVGEYVRERRIEFACRELTNLNNTISEIAAAAGFFDQSHFTRTFKRLLGVTPGEFRKQLRPH